MIGYELFDLIRISIAMSFVLVVLLAYVALDWYFTEWLPPEPQRERPITHITGETPIQEIDQ